MAMGYGAQIPRFDDNPKPASKGIRGAYEAAVDTNAADYDKIMRGYDDILNSSQSNAANSKLNYVPINPIFTKQLQGTAYSRSGDLDQAISGLEDISRTGGYSDADIGNIRERSISPIRSIYSSAQEGLRRNKVLQGGYAPGYGAASAKMARESAGQIGDITTRVNADIAEKVAAGKKAGLDALSGVAGRENELINANNVRNTGLRNQTELMNADEERRVEGINNDNMFKIEGLNRAGEQQNNATQLGALSGKTNLYGTNPALTHEFANQVLQNNQQNLQAVQTANQLKNQRANIGLNLVQQQLSPRMG